MTPSQVAAFARARFQWQGVPLFVVRLLAIGAAAGALTYGVVGVDGVVAAVLGSLLGATAGHGVALTRLRLPLLLAGALGVGVVGGLIGYLAIGDAAFVRMLGPSLALDLSAIARFGGYAAAIAATLRILAVRAPSLVSVELVAIATAVVVPLSPHREGVVARPLWLSDWAWHNGYDPAHVLIAIGGVVALVLGGLLMARTGNRVSLISWLALAALLMLGVSVLDVGGLPQPQAGNDLGLTGDERGDPPLPTGLGPWEGPGKSHDKGGQGQPQDGKADQGKDSGGGGKPDNAEGDGGGGTPREGKSGEGKSGEGKSGEGKSGEGKSGEGKSGEGKQPDGKGGASKPAKDGKGGGGKPPPKEPDLDDEDSPSQGTPAPMAVVLFGDDYLPPSGGYYFRQDVWSHFNGSRLVASRRPDVDRDVLKTFPSSERAVADLPPDTGARTPVNAQVFLAVKHTQPFALEGLVKMKPVRNPNAERFVRAYEFDSLAQSIEFAELLGKKTGSPQWSPDVFEYYSVTPEDARYEELAQTIISALPEDIRGDPFAQALAIKLWLDDNITYSTSERHAGVEDPAADFLFGNRIGYCVHIAHAAAYLWRTRGIPARVGTGYRASLDNLRGSALVIRGSDAHAWPELYLEGVGWVVLDVAPKKTLDEPTEPADDELTEQLADVARQEGDEEAKRADSDPDDGKKRLALPFQMLMVLGVALVVLYAIKIWRRLAPYWVRGRPLPRVAYRRALDQLAECGHIRDFGETRTAFAARVRAVAPSLSTLANLSEAARLGAPTADLRTRAEFTPLAWKQGLVALNQDLARHVSLRRRILGILNPIAFWQVR